MSEIFNAFLSSALMSISVYVFGIVIFGKNKNLNLFNKMILMIINIILYAEIYINFNGTFKTILLCILVTLTYKFVFEKEMVKALLSSILFLILLIIPDLIVTLFFIYVVNIGKGLFYNKMAGGIISNASVSVLMLILTYFLRKPLRKIVNINISTNKKIICVSMLTLIVMAIFFYNLIQTFEFNNDIAGFLMAIFSLMAILIYVFKQKIDNTTILKKYDELLDIMKNYESDIEEQRTLIHETRNEFSTIRCKIKDNENEDKIIKYIDSVMGDKVSSNMSKLSKFAYLPSNGLKGFFYYKFTEAERKGINVSINISKQIENSFLGILDTKNFKDLSRIIGVYVDNAIEASSISDEKKLGIEIYLIKNSIDIIISNTYANTINKEKIGNEKYSTKGKKRGHGLLLVKRILSENKMISSKTEITDMLYIQKIKINNNNKKDQY